VHDNQHTIFDKLDAKKSKDIRVLSDFLTIFCQEKHKSETKEAFKITDRRLAEALRNKHPVLCQDCSKLLNHGVAKLLLCPFDPKPTCKKCPRHCYAPGYREKIRQVMRFSGMYLLRHGRLDLLFHYLF
jgi:hypothetical protein